MKETTYYDAQGRRVKAEDAVKAEITTRSKEGSVLSVEYYSSKKQKDRPVDELKRTK